MYDTILILADTVESSEHDTEKTDSDNLACLLRMKDIIEKQVILPTASGGVERRAEFGALGPRAGCFLALGFGLGLVGTVSSRR